MFSFFQKKIYLADHLHGLVDMHNHILPGIDDGAKTVDESIGMIRGFGEIGITHFICTPHIMHNYYDNTPKTIKEAHRILLAGLEETDLFNVSIDHAAEHMIDDNFEAILENGQVMPLGKTHLLVEMSYLQPSINFDISIKKIQEAQFHPILAHPERYLYFHKEQAKYKEFKNNGIKFQLNLLSLTGYYGKSIQKIALKLLGEGFYDFIASDAHNTRHIGMIKEGIVQKNTIPFINHLTMNTIEEFL